MSREFLPLYRAPVRRELGTAGVFLVLLVLLRWRVIWNLASHYAGGVNGDGGLYIWLMHSALGALSSGDWFEVDPFYPYGKGLAWSDNFILPALCAYPLLKLGAPAAAVFNILVLAANFLNGFFTYRLAFRLSGQWLLSVSSGAAFMSLSYFSGNLGHPQLQFAFWLPLGLLALFSFLSSPNLWDALRLGLIVFLTFLTTVYYSIFLGLMVAAVLAGVALMRPEYFSLRNLLLFFSGLALGMAPCLPFALPYLSVKQVFEGRALYEAYYFSASALSYLSSSPWNLIYSATSAFSHSEAQLFPGMVLLAAAPLAFARLGGTKRLSALIWFFAASFLIALLASALTPLVGWARYLCAGAIWVALLAFLLLLYRVGSLERKLGFNILTERALVAQLLLIGLVFFALSLGPLGNPEKGHLALGPFTFFHLICPGMDALRAVSRAGIVAIFCLCLTLPWIGTFLAKRKLLPSSRALALCVPLILLENLVTDYPLEPLPPAPQVLQQLREARLAGDALVFVPMAAEIDKNRQVRSWSDYAARNVLAMNWAQDLGVRLVNGYSGQRSNLMRDLPGQLAGFPDVRSLANLESIAGLRFIVYQSQNDPKFDRAAFFTRVTDAGSLLSLLGVDDEGNYLFEFQPLTRLDSKFSLLVPVREGGSAQLELMAGHEKSPREVNLDVLSNGARLTGITLSTNGLWQNFSVALPQAPDKVRPIKLEFVPPDNAPIFLRARRFSR